MYLFSVLKDVLCVANTQHNCCENNCDLSGTRRIREEREVTDRAEATVHHYNAEDLILNLGQMRHAVHYRHFR